MSVIEGRGRGGAALVDAVNGGVSETTIALGFQPGEMPAKIYDPFDD
jgi:hypothetical protein